MQNPNQKLTFEALARLARSGQEQLRAQVIRQLMANGHLTEDDLANIQAEDVERLADRCLQAIRSNPELLAMVERFRDDPNYLARALTQVAPEVFYSYGFAYRQVFRLRAELGIVLVPPRKPWHPSESSVYLDKLPQLVKGDLMALDRERLFRRECLWWFSRDPADAFRYLDELIAGATTDFDRQVLTELRHYCEQLLSEKFDGFIADFDGGLFPAFHVRWWMDRAREKTRVLNIGDTGAQKTSFACVALHQAGCRKVLVICPPHAKGNWRREIHRYRSKDLATIVRRQGLAETLAKTGEYTIIGYSTLIAPETLPALQAAAFDGLIIDESHYGNNVKRAKRADVCAELVRSLGERRVIALSATPWENHPRELGAIASILKPDVFPSAAAFRRARPEHPRFLREFFAEHILDVELDEIVDLGVTITPNPKEDLFGAVFIAPNPTQRAIYDFIRECDTTPVVARQKVRDLLAVGAHPCLMRDRYPWPVELARAFSRPELSTKLMWVKDRIQRELTAGAKVVVGAGLFISGITRPRTNQSDEVWVGGLLKQWFGDDQVLILDQHVSVRVDEAGKSDRDRLIDVWRSDPRKRILLVSMHACPDSVNLTVPGLPGVTKLFVTALQFTWKPWKQFLGRFWRYGLGVNLEYAVPILRGMIDENLLQLLDRKWWAMRLFRAQAPLTDEEFQLFSRRQNIRALAEAAKPDYVKVNVINGMVRGQGEEAAMQVLQVKPLGGMSNAEILADAFVRCQEYTASGHISRATLQVTESLRSIGWIAADGTTILDAGCGPLTLERRLNQPVYGVDFNPYMIEVGKSHSPRWQGRNAGVGRLSALPESWSGKFELTVASLVMDWTATPTAGTLGERCSILAELVRVTHPVAGRVWLTFTHQTLDDATHRAWRTALEAMRYQIVDQITGKMRSTDGRRGDPPFTFWSICFIPAGRPFTPANPLDFRFTFEVERSKVKRKRNQDPTTSEVTPRKLEHHEFEVVQPSGKTIDLHTAADLLAKSELQRLVHTPSLQGWRPYKKLDPARADWEDIWRTVVRHPSAMNELRARGFID